MEKFKSYELMERDIGGDEMRVAMMKKERNEEKKWESLDIDEIL